LECRLFSAVLIAGEFSKWPQAIVSISQSAASASVEKFHGYKTAATTAATARILPGHHTHLLPAQQLVQQASAFIGVKNTRGGQKFLLLLLTVSRSSMELSRHL